MCRARVPLSAGAGMLLGWLALRAYLTPRPPLQILERMRLRMGGRRERQNAHEPAVEPVVGIAATSLADARRRPPTRRRSGDGRGRTPQSGRWYTAVTWLEIASKGLLPPPRRPGERARAGAAGRSRMLPLSASHAFPVRSRPPTSKAPASSAHACSPKRFLSAFDPTRCILSRKNAARGSPESGWRPRCWGEAA